MNKHRYYWAGEPDCPLEIKAGNGELHTLRCRDCGLDNPKDPCAALPERAPVSAGGDAYFRADVVHEMLQVAYRTALPPAGSQLRCANQIEAADTVLAMEADRAVVVPLGSVDSLPPLPEPLAEVAVYIDHGPSLRQPLEDYYTAEQMREYAKAVRGG